MKKIKVSMCLVVLLVLIGGGAEAFAFGADKSGAKNKTGEQLKGQTADSVNVRVLSKRELQAQKRLLDAEQDNSNWLLHGRTYAEQRFSPLKKINHKNVSSLGYAWSFDMNSTRGLEATPIVSNGVMFITGAWSIVYAIDARTGKELWKYDPKVPGEWGRKGCCDIVNRGVAVWGDTVFSGTFDGRLIALDAKTGKLLWEQNTIDRTKNATITGAPRVVNGKVFIGNGGAEFGLRGYISAYDAVDGKLVWRFYTVPKSPDGPHENAEMAEAAKTWSKDGAWIYSGGGGTVWDSLSFDPELNLLYVGTGNGAPHARHKRSPGGGDNLFLSSILALDVDTGEMRWFYQTTPGDSWDFTATQHMILADVEIEGKLRKVLMQAPKNGFFYVLDRETGKVISAEKMVTVNWASHVDLDTGRPVETGQGDYSKENKLVFPSELGGHNWHPMSYSPETNLVYVPALERGWLHSPTGFYVFRFNLPEDHEQYEKGQPKVDEGGYLKAWDPVKQELAWQVKNETYINGGTLATAGNLVFQGTEGGHFNAYNARTGERLLNKFVGTGIIAPPITYSLDGEQYVAVMAGFGGASLFMLDDNAAAHNYRNSGRLIVMKLNGDEVPLPNKIPAEPVITKLGKDTPQEFKQGEQLYVMNCGFCHGVYGSKSILPDLSKMSPGINSIFKQIVLDGVFESKGMTGFADVLTEEQVEEIQRYLNHQGEIKAQE